MPLPKDGLGRARDFRGVKVLDIILDVSRLFVLFTKAY